MLSSQRKLRASQPPLTTGGDLVTPAVPYWPMRDIRCPACAKIVQIARKAISVRCPLCSSPIQLENTTLVRTCISPISTLGRVRVAKKAVAHGKIECGTLSVVGRILGQIKVNGHADLDSGAKISGKLSARSITVTKGATLDAEINIGPVSTNRTQHPECA